LQSWLASNLFLPVKFVENGNRCNIYQTGTGTTPAADASKVVMRVEDVFPLPHEAVPLAKGAALAEIVAASDSGEFIQLA
jgi:hypothetical protein